MKTYFIYKLYITNKPENIYVGSTQNFKNRCQRHKYNCIDTEVNERTLYNMINENGGWINVTADIIEEFMCDTKLDARIKEEHYRKTLNANMNTRKAVFTLEDKRNAYRKYMRSDRGRENKKKYNKTYNDKIADIYINCECGSTVKKVSYKEHVHCDKHKKFILNNCENQPALE